mmetsp:Transcript_42179/g.100855  ORF Transcript_42179/g.100855 Transcript_42179/m.100855 type:complete len:474 (-) Transcript_42179:961-2382(-)
MRHASKLHTLPCGKGFPVRVASHPRQLGTEVHEAGGVLVGSEEEQLLMPFHVPRVDPALGRQHAVQERVQVPDEARALRRGALRGRSGKHVAAPGGRPGGVRQDDALGTTLRDVLVLVLLRECEVVALVEQRRVVPLVRRLVPGEHQADAAAGDVSEADVESVEVAALDEVDGIGQGRVEVCGPVLQHHCRVQAEGEGARRLGLEEVGQEQARVEGQDHAEDLPVLGLAAGRVDRVPELLVVLGLGLADGDAVEVLEELDGEAQVALEEFVDALCGQQLLHAELVESLQLPLAGWVLLQDLVHCGILPCILLLGEECIRKLHSRQQVQSDLMRDLSLHHAEVDALRLPREGLQKGRVHDRSLQALDLRLLGAGKEDAVRKGTVRKRLEVETLRAQALEAHGRAQLGEEAAARGLGRGEEQDVAAGVGPGVGAARDDPGRGPARGHEVLHDDLVLLLGRLRLLLEELRRGKHLN